MLNFVLVSFFFPVPKPPTGVILHITLLATSLAPLASVFQTSLNDHDNFLRGQTGILYKILCFLLRQILRWNICMHKSLEIVVHQLHRHCLFLKFFMKLSSLLYQHMLSLCGKWKGQLFNNFHFLHEFRYKETQFSLVKFGNYMLVISRKLY